MSLELAASTGREYTWPEIAFSGILLGLFFVYALRSRHDEMMQSPRGLWRSPPTWVRLIARKGPGPVRILGFVQSLIAFALTTVSAGVLTGLFSGSASHISLGLLLFLVIFGVGALSLIDWFVGLLWHRTRHPRHLELLREFEAALGNATDPQLRQLWVSVTGARAPEQLPGVRTSSRSERRRLDPAVKHFLQAADDYAKRLSHALPRPLATSELMELNGFANGVLLEELPPEQRPRRRGPRALRWLGGTEYWYGEVAAAAGRQLDLELLGGLNVAFATCRLVWLQDEMDPEAVGELTRPWRDVIGQLPAVRGAATSAGPQPPTAPRPGPDR